jgi:hypothetical protein
MEWRPFIRIFNASEFIRLIQNRLGKIPAGQCEAKLNSSFSGQNMGLFPLGLGFKTSLWNRYL